MASERWVRMRSRSFRHALAWIFVWAAWVVPAPAAAVCVPDGQVVVSLSLSKTICDSAPEHVANAACCSGEASPVWNAATNKCDTTCDSSDPCAYVTCTAQDQCHLVGTCNSATGLCSNPVKANNSPCSDGNSCTSGDKCTGGFCVTGPLLTGCCGNGDVEAGEQCDDGNQVGGNQPIGPDGCAPNCTIDAGWACAGEPSDCCIDDDQVRFSLPIDQNQCQSIKGSPDAGCCQGSHKGVWTGSTCNIVCSVDKCNPAPGYGTPADYGCFAIPCQTTSPCDPNNGCTHAPVGAGIACGSSATTACTASDTCDGAGTCKPNDAVAGTECSNGMQCNYAECNGSGTCVDSSALIDGQYCDDLNNCTPFDQCQAGACEPGAPIVCQPFDGCHLAGVCDPVTGNCSNPLAPFGTPCGSLLPLHEQCDLPDSCDDFGSCLSNSFDDNTPCGPPTGTCFSTASCADGTCAAGPVQLPTEAGCGDTSYTECDYPDTCDNLGACQPNHNSDGTPCGGVSSCTTAGTCAAGACEGATSKPSGTACGDSDPLGDCDAADTCDGSGHCQANLLAASHVCRSAAGACDVAESCDGATPVCPADAFEPQGAPCGNPEACPADQCDGAGSCQPTIGECTSTTTTSTTLDGSSTTTTDTTVTRPSTSTTLAPAGQCAGVVGPPHARCLIDVALAGDLCDGGTIPPKLEQKLRALLAKTGVRVDGAIAKEGAKRVRLLKKARKMITAVGRKAAAAQKSKNPAKQISAPCAGGLGQLVSSIQADLS